jgi:thermitase
MSRRLPVLVLVALLLAASAAATQAQPSPEPVAPDAAPDAAPAEALPAPWRAGQPVGPGAPSAMDDPADVPEPGYVANQLLVRFRPGTSREEMAALHARYGAQVIAEIPQLGVQVLRLYDATTVAVTAYQANQQVQYAEPNYLAEILGAPDPVQPPTALGAGPAAQVNDPLFGQQWHHVKIHSPEAWDRSRGQGVTVAIVDTGVACNHADLAGKCVAGYDFVNMDADPRDDHGHGTHVAGISAAATHNGVGVAGVGYDARIMPMKALGATGNGGHASIASAITWAADNGAQVINMSLGGPFTSSTLRNAVAYAIGRGVTVVAAAGNDNTSNPTYPAAYPDVIGISATTQSDGRASFSNYGTYIDVAAPGVGIMSSVMSGSYQAWSGTSMASPVAAGLAALLKAQDMGRSPAQITQIMQSTADDLGAAGWDQLFGYGRINAQRALAAGNQPTLTPVTPQPSRTPGPATATPQVIGGSCDEQVEILINDERARNGLAPLSVHTALRAAADRHALDMATNRFCSHTGSDNSSPYDRMRDAGYSAPYGEIVACGQTSPQAAVQAWMNSEGHRAIILCSNCTELGAGCRTSTSLYRYYWVVNFGSRRVTGPTATTRPSATATPRPTNTFTPVPPTVTVAPTDLPNSRTVTLTPPNNRIGWVVSNEPNVNHFDDTDTFTGFNSSLTYHGAMQFDLSPLPAGAFINWARLEMTGRTRAYLGNSGTWTVNILTSDIDPGFAQFGYSRIHTAYIEATLLPMLGLEDLGAGRLNVFNFQPSQLATIGTRLASTGLMSFRMDGPASGSGLNLFTWDSGYGAQTTYPGPKLVVNYSLVAPTATPSPTPTDPPPPTDPPTAGPSATATQTSPPPTATFTAPPPPPSRTPTATEPSPIPTVESNPILEIRPVCDGDVGWVRQGEIDNHFGDDNLFSGFYQGLIYRGGLQFDLTGIPPRSRIVAARLTLTGQSTRYLAAAGNGHWQVKVLSDAIDIGWRTAGYNQVNGARELTALNPTLLQGDVGVGLRNTFVFDADQLATIEQRVSGTRKISFRVDGPSAGNSNIMDWDTGCGPGIHDAPVLQVQFGAVEPGEPLPTDLPESRQKGLEMIDAINQARRDLGLSPLALSEELMTAARVHNLDISSKDLFTHTGSDGSQPIDRVLRTGFDATVVGEVLAMGSPNVPPVLSAWMNRDSQKEQFLRADLTHIGAHWAPALQATFHNYWTVVTARRR